MLQNGIPIFYLCKNNNMILTESMMRRMSEPGIWFIKSSHPTKDIGDLIYDLSVITGVPVSVVAPNNRQIQNDIIAKVMKDCIGQASDEVEKNRLESEMAEYNTHGLFFYPNRMNDYAINGSFWSDYVFFHENEWEYVINYPGRIIIVEDLYTLSFDGEKDIVKILKYNHKDAIEKNTCIIVFVQNQNLEVANEFIENRLLNGFDPSILTQFAREMKRQQMSLRKMCQKHPELRQLMKCLGLDIDLSL